MNIYDVSDIIGKTLFAKQTVAVYRGDQVPNGKPFAYVKPNAPVGVVYSYLSPGSTGRVNVWWQYYDDVNGAYYSEMTVGRYSVEAIRQQGVLSTQEKIEAEQIKNQTLPEFFKANFMKIVYFAGLVIVAKNVLPLLKK